MSTRKNTNYNPLKIEYESNERFKDYVNAYSVSRQVSVDTALTHEMVRNVARDYNDRNLK